MRDEVKTIAHLVPMVVDEDAPRGRCLCGEPFDEDGRCPVDKRELAIIQEALGRHFASEDAGITDV